MRRLILALAVMLGAQQPEEPTIRVSVSLVQVDAIVTGRDRKIVRGLGAADFELLQDGAPQKIDAVSFIELARPTSAPALVPVGPAIVRPEQAQRVIAIVVDDLNLSHVSMSNARQGLRKFVESSVLPGTLVCILRTAGGVGNLQTLTSDRGHLLAIVDSLKWNPRATAGADPDSPPSAFRNADSLGVSGSEARARQEVSELASDMRALGTTAAIEWAFRGIRTLPGRKSMVLITDGIPLKIVTPFRATPTRALPRFQRLAAEAHRAGVVFYTIHPGGLREHGLSTTGEEDALAYMPAQTGGEFFRDRNFLENDLGRIVEDQSGYYLLSYRPPPGTFDRKYHKIEVRARGKGLIVRSRRELFGEELQEPSPSENELARALLSPFQSGAIPLRLTALYMVDASGKPVVRCLLHIDAKSVRRVEDAGAMRATLEVVTAGVDAAGRLSAVNSNRFEAKLQADEVARLERSGFLYGVEFGVDKPGPYQIRAAAKDPVSGLLGSATQFLEIPDLARKRLALSGVVLDRKREGAAQTTEADPLGNPAVRRYRPGDSVAYAMQMYNARRGRNGAKLTSQVLLYREGKIAFEGRRDPLPIGAEVDPAIVPLGGVFHLGKSMPAGNYVAELRVADASGAKAVLASQWIDFTVE